MGAGFRLTIEKMKPAPSVEMAKPNFGLKPN
jgi:hypothetical protein